MRNIIRARACGYVFVSSSASSLTLLLDSRRVSVIPFHSLALLPLPSMRAEAELLRSRYSAPLIAGISHRRDRRCCRPSFPFALPSLQLLQKSFPEVLMVLSPSLSLSLSLSFCSQAENRICGVLVKKWGREEGAAAAAGCRSSLQPYSLFNYGFFYSSEVVLSHCAAVMSVASRRLCVQRCNM